MVFKSVMPVSSSVRKMDPTLRGEERRRQRGEREMRVSFSVEVSERSCLETAKVSERQTIRYPALMHFLHSKGISK
jgi:hypothetical protein